MRILERTVRYIKNIMLLVWRYKMSMETETSLDWEKPGTLELDTCPDCGASDSFIEDEKLVICKYCGYTKGDSKCLNN